MDLWLNAIPIKITMGFYRYWETNWTIHMVKQGPRSKNNLEKRFISYNIWFQVVRIDCRSMKQNKGSWVVLSLSLSLSPSLSLCVSRWDLLETTLREISGMMKTFSICWCVVVYTWVAKFYQTGVMCLKSLYLTILKFYLNCKKTTKIETKWPANEKLYFKWQTIRKIRESGWNEMEFKYNNLKNFIFSKE